MTRTEGLGPKPSTARPCGPSEASFGLLNQARSRASSAWLCTLCS